MVGVVILPKIAFIKLEGVSKVFFEENLHLIISKLRIKKWQFS